MCTVAVLAKLDMQQNSKAQFEFSSVSSNFLDEIQGRQEKFLEWDEYVQ